MFDYSEKDIYERSGFTQVPIGENIPNYKGSFIDEKEVEHPILEWQESQGYCYSKCLCLHTFLGYIPIDEIEAFPDVFKRKRYLHDEMVAIHPYQEEKVSQKEQEKVKRLAHILGCHWK